MIVTLFVALMRTVKRHVLHHFQDLQSKNQGMRGDTASFIIKLAVILTFILVRVGMSLTSSCLLNSKLANLWPRHQLHTLIDTIDESITTICSHHPDLFLVSGTACIVYASHPVDRVTQPAAPPVEDGYARIRRSPAFAAFAWAHAPMNTNRPIHQFVHLLTGRWSYRSNGNVNAASDAPPPWLETVFGNVSIPKTLLSKFHKCDKNEMLLPFTYCKNKGRQIDPPSFLAKMHNTNPSPHPPIPPPLTIGRTGAAESPLILVLHIQPQHPRPERHVLVAILVQQLSADRKGRGGRL